MKIWRPWRELSGLLDQIDALKARQEARVKTQRDGTLVGDLKAEYLAALYQRRNTLQSIEILESTGVADNIYPKHYTYRAEIEQLDQTLADLECRLSDAGVTVKKVRAPKKDGSA